MLVIRNKTFKVSAEKSFREIEEWNSIETFKGCFRHLLQEKAFTSKIKALEINSLFTQREIANVDKSDSTNEIKNLLFQTNCFSENVFYSDMTM